MAFIAYCVHESSLVTVKRVAGLQIAGARLIRFLTSATSVADFHSHLYYIQSPVFLLLVGGAASMASGPRRDWEALHDTGAHWLKPCISSLIPPPRLERTTPKHRFRARQSL